MLKKLFIGVYNAHRSNILTCASKAFWPPLELFVSSAWVARRNADQGNQSYPTRGRLVSFLGLVLLAFVFSGEVLAQTQIVNCDAQVQSRKRGIAVNSMSAADFEAVAPGVSWYYNWGATPLTLPGDVTMDFIPMAWNGSSGFQTSISSYLAAGNRPWRVFALNEPNLLGQAYMTPSNSAVTFLQVKAICDPYNIPVIAPHMAIGSAVGSSITAYDPIMGSNYVYTYQEPFIAAFLYYCGSTPPTGMGTHSYGGYGEITWITSTMHTDFPTQTVWLTEFDANGATSDSQVLATLIPAVDYCENTPWIEGYSWFMSRITGDPYNSLLTTSSGVLTAAGQAYVQMPVHQTNLYYRIPGRLQAERYVTMNQMNIAPTTDTNGLADMITAAAGGSLDYNIQVDTAGSYPLNFRVAGAVGLISVYEGGTLLGTANSTQTGWATVSTTVTLPAGTQTLHVVLAANAQQVNWMEFESANGTLAIPTGLSATAGNGQVTLSWSPAAGATGYNVQSSTTEGGPYTTIASPTTTSYTNTGLANGTTYYYVVSATAGSIVSSNSVEVGATPVLSHVNLALNHPVTVSSTQAGYPGSNAVDGNTSTRWASAWTTTEWIYVDLQATYNITEVEIYWEAAYAASFQIQVSSDATNWTSIYSTITGQGGVQDLTGLSGTGRYVRMYGTVRGLPAYGYSIYEFQVYGTVPAPTNHPPVLAAISNQTIMAGRTLLVTNSATDADLPAQTLTFSLLSAPTNAAINSSSGLFNWRPIIAQSPSTQTVAVVVSDNGTPVMSATQGFTVTVTQPAIPALNTVSITNGQFGFLINGSTGPDYTILVSTNLASWNPVFTGNSLPVPYFWVDTNSLSYPLRFYRAVLGP
jgi:hypothetical protein